MPTLARTRRMRFPTSTAQRLCCIAVALLGACRSASEWGGEFPGQPSRPAVADPKIGDLIDRIRVAKHEGRSDKAAVDDLLHRMRDGSLSDDAWQAIVVGLDLVHSRARWPACEPLQLWVRTREVFGPCRTSIQAYAPDLGSVTVGSLDPARDGSVAMMQRDEERGVVLHALPAESSFVLCVMSFDLTGSGSELARKEGTPTWTGLVPIPVRAVASVDEVLVPASGPELDAAVRSAIRRIELVDSSGAREPFLRIGGEFEMFPWMRELGVSLDIDIMRGDQIVETLRASANHPVGWGVAGLDAVMKWPDSLRGMTREQADQERWTLHVKGTSSDLLGVWEVSKRWDGQFVMPVSEVMSEVAGVPRAAR